MRGATHCQAASAASDWSRIFVLVARSALVRAGNFMRQRMLALFWCKIGPFKSLQNHAIHPCLSDPAQSPVPSTLMHSQDVYTGCRDNDFFLMGAAAHDGQRTLGRRAATLSSSTELIYIFFAVCCMRLLPASVSSARPLLTPVVLTRPPVVLLSLLSLQVLHTTVAAAARSRRARSSISWPRAFVRCEKRFGGENFGACGGPRAIVDAAGWR